jgi:hypothetical protein
MAELDLTNLAASSISTPASGVTAAFVDTDKNLKTKDDAGLVVSYLRNNSGSAAAQTPAATTRTYITGTKITVPPGKLQIGTMFRWRFNITKTGAGTATSTFDVAVGTAGTTADTARLSFTKPAGTAVIDEGWIEIVVVVRGPLSASGVMVGEFTLIHNLQITGHAIIPCVAVSTVSGAFDVTVANLFVGVCITSGASDAITIQFATAEAWNL